MYDVYDLVLFDIFDFNNQNCLSLADVYYIMLTVIKSVFKMMKVNSFVNEDAIIRFIDDNLADTPKINVSIMVKYRCFIIQTMHHQQRFAGIFQYRRQKL